MTIYANLIIGRDGSTSSNGTSKILSSEEDRKRFHELRKKVDCIFIGGKTARLEPYSKTPVPLVVVSTSSTIHEIAENDKANIFNLEPKLALELARSRFGENILVEGGPNLLLEIIEYVDELYVTISEKSGDGQTVSFDGITRGFIMENLEKINGDIFYKFKREK